MRVLRVSPIYETEPVDFTAQRWFLNLVVEAETACSRMQLLARIGTHRAALGRVRDGAQGTAHDRYRHPAVWRMR